MSDNKNNNEEVDLGSLFIIIGKGFSKIGSFINNLFKKLTTFLILTLLFLKQHILKIVIGVVVGAIVGFILEKNLDTKYESILQVEPNFGSAKQLYNNINYYNDLIKQKNTDLLAKTFNISKEEAQSLKNINIEPIANESDLLNNYTELTKKIDTITSKNYSYDKFKETVNVYDYHTHKITAIATQNDIFKKLTPTIVLSITKNNYFEKLKAINDENLKKTNNLIQKNLQQADSLHDVYKKVLINESRKENSGTNISTGNGKIPEKELSLFQINKDLNEDLENISEKISKKTEIINIISDFQPIGHKISTEITRNKTFQLAFIGGILVIMYLLLIKLNKYLVLQEKRNL